MKKIIILFVLSLFMPLITSCYQNDKCTCCDEGFYTDPNEVPVHWNRGFYRNVVDLTDLGIRLGMREDGYYQIMEVNGDFSKKSELVLPSHYEGIPIMGIGIPRDGGTGRYSNRNMPFNDYSWAHNYFENYSLDLKQEYFESINTIYINTHHMTDLYDNGYVINEDFEKVVYMCDINRNQNKFVPHCNYHDKFGVPKENHESVFWRDIKREIAHLVLGCQEEYNILNNKDIVIVIPPGIKDKYMDYLKEGKDYYQDVAGMTEEEIIAAGYVEVLFEKYYDKWLVEPNIYFYNNTSETDEDIYWFDYETNGELIFTPYEPYNNGKTFLGWYTEKECINKWNFDTKIELGENEVLNLYAKWGN